MNVYICPTPYLTNQQNKDLFSTHFVSPSITRVTQFNFKANTPMPTVDKHYLHAGLNPTSRPGALPIDTLTRLAGWSRATLILNPQR